MDRHGLTELPYPFYTVGHSTRSTAEFIALLRVGEVALVVGITTHQTIAGEPAIQQRGASGKFGSIRHRI